MAARAVVSTALIIALSAMHPFLHPALRPPWHLRMRAQRVAQHKLTDTEMRAAAVGTAAATKEAVRRLLASTIQAAPAMQNAFAHVGHPVGLLVAPPFHLPARGMEAAMSTFASVGVSFALGSFAAMSYVPTVDAAFHDEGRQAGEEGPEAVEWEAPWLGTCLAAGASNPCLQPPNLL